MTVLALLAFLVGLWLLVTLAVPVVVAHRRGAAAGGDLLSNLYAVPAEPIDWALERVVGAHPTVAGWWERARAHALRGGWLPWRALGALLALVFWVGALLLQLRLDSQMIALLDPGQDAARLAVGFQANARLITGLLVMANTVSGLLCTDLLGLTGVLPARLDGHARWWALAGAGVAVAGLLALQGAVGAGRADAVYAQALRQPEVMAASAATIRRSAAGAPDVDAQAAALEGEAVALRGEAARKRGLNRVVSVALPVLAAVVEAATSWTLAALVALAALLAAGTARVVHAFAWGVLALGRRLVDRTYTVHHAVLAQFVVTPDPDGDRRRLPAGEPAEPPAGKPAEPAGGKPSDAWQALGGDGAAPGPGSGPDIGAVPAADPADADGVSPPTDPRWHGWTVP